LHTFKSHIAKIDNFGYDYQLNERGKLFNEYYQEQADTAITSNRVGLGILIGPTGGLYYLGLALNFQSKYFNLPLLLILSVVSVVIQQ